ncbi:MAG: hypothetical protein ACRDS9_13950 [Pseudonocardiaceae bacterium]
MTGVRIVRELSGTLAAGLVALAIVVCVAQWLAGTSGSPGPGMTAVTGHGAAALAAVVLQLSADRLRGRLAMLACGAVLVIVAAVLWFGWYA